MRFLRNCLNLSPTTLKQLLAISAFLLGAPSIFAAERAVQLVTDFRSAEATYYWAGYAPYDYLGPNPPTSLYRSQTVSELLLPDEWLNGSLQTFSVGVPYFYTASGDKMAWDGSLSFVLTGHYDDTRGVHASVGVRGSGSIMIPNDSHEIFFITSGQPVEDGLIDETYGPITYEEVEDIAKQPSVKLTANPGTATLTDIDIAYTPQQSGASRTQTYSTATTVGQPTVANNSTFVMTLPYTGNGWSTALVSGSTTTTSQKWKNNDNRTGVEHTWTLGSPHTFQNAIDSATTQAGTALTTAAWTRSPAYAKRDVANPPAYSAGGASSQSVNIRKAEFQFGFQSEEDIWYAVTWTQITLFEDGSTPIVEKFLETIKGNGSFVKGTPHILNPPLSKDGSTYLDRAGIERLGVCGAAGAATLQLGSVDVRFDLGAGLFGRPAGTLWLRADKPSASLATSDALLFLPTAGDATMVTIDANTKQVDTRQCRAKITRVTAYKYTIEYYGRSGSGYLTTPYATWTVENPNGATHFNTLNVTESRAGKTYLTTYNYGVSGLTETWTATFGNNTRAEELTVQWAANHKTKTETRTIRDPLRSNEVVAKSRRVYQLIENGGTAWGYELTSEVLDPDVAALTTTYAYHTTGNGVGQLKRKLRYDGYWEEYTYDSSGRLDQMLSPFGNTASTNPTAVGDGTIVTKYDYQLLDVLQGVTVDTGDSPELPRRVYVSRNARTGGTSDKNISTTYDGYKKVPIGSGNFRKSQYHYEVHADGGAWDDAMNLDTITVYHPDGDPFAGKVRAIKRPDNTVEVYEYLDTNGSGTPWPLSERRTTISAGKKSTTATLETILGSDITEGTRTVTTVNDVGEMISRVVTDIQSGRTISSEGFSIYDELRRPKRVTTLDGKYADADRSCCGISSYTDKDGTITSYGYDDLKRLTTTTLNNITVSNVLDAAGNLLGVVRHAGGPPMTLSTAVFDDAGRQTSITDALGNPTTFQYQVSSGVLVKTTTYADTGTRIETFRMDGRLASISGTGVRPITYEYGVVPHGSSLPNRFYVKEIRKLDGSTPKEYSTSFFDLIGRPFKTVFSTTEPATSYPTETVDYNALGQKIKHVDPDGVATAFTYDDQGRLLRVAADLNNNGISDDEAMNSEDDRITETTYSVAAGGAPYSNKDVLLTEVRAFDANDATTKRLIASRAVATDGLDVWERIYRDASTPVTTWTHTDYVSPGVVNVTTTRPDGSKTVQGFTGGRLTSVTEKDSANSQVTYQSFGYDAHGRQTSAYDARTGTTYFSYNNADQLSTTTTPAPGDGPAQTVIQTYDNMGRPNLVTLADGTTVTRQYHLTGELKKTFGSRLLPVEYGYNSEGRLSDIKTWQDYTLPEAVATTSFQYDPFTGRLLRKVHPGETDGTDDFEYTSAGRIKKRISERQISSTHITATYTYNGAGQTATVIYNDSTRQLTYKYDRRGRLTRVDQGTSPVVTTTLTYNDANLLTSEAVSGGSQSTWSVAPGYDTSLRRNQLLIKESSTTHIQHDYQYDAASRLQHVFHGVYRATYSYLANSHLVSQISHANNGSARMLTTRNYDLLNRLQTTQSQPQGTAATQGVYFDYGFNAANQRQTVTLADGSYWEYAYDAKGQVSSARKHWPDHSLVEGQQFEYAYDDIGNRVTTKVGGDQNGSNLRNASYTRLSSNQYDNRTTPDYVNIIGTARANETVTVNSQAASRKGEYFRSEVAVTHGTATWPSITVNVNGTSDPTKKHFVPPALEDFDHDADGNLRFDGRSTAYAWDAENRLVQVTTLFSDGVQRAISYEYDFLGRRISRTVWPTSAAGTGTPTSKTCYLHDGWNIVAELSLPTAGSATLLRSYMWGLDQSGSRTGAGGVGGLVLIAEHNLVAGAAPDAWHFVGSDGNGNVALLVSAADGLVTGRYEYGPFGEPIRVTGSATSTIEQANPFRFSSKLTDQYTGLVYYGYRDYNPSTGRWLTRDPLGEAGGINLYGFVGNDPVNGIDPLGLILFDNYSNTALVFIGRQIDPRSHWENLVSGDSFRTASAYSAQLFRAGGRMIEMGWDFTQWQHRMRADPVGASEEALQVAQRMWSSVSVKNLKCLFLGKLDEFNRASPERQMEMLGALTGEGAFMWATGAATTGYLEAVVGAQRAAAIRARVLDAIAENQAATQRIQQGLANMERAYAEAAKSGTLALPAPRAGSFNPHLPGGSMTSFEVGESGLFLPAGRAHGANPAGSFLSLDPIPNQAFVRGPLSTLPDWNPATHVSDAFVPPGVRLQISIANPHPSLPGSGYGLQLQILNDADKARIVYSNTRPLQ